VALDGLYDLWPRGRSFNWRLLVPGRAKVPVEFGPPIRSTRGAYAEGTAALRAAVAVMFDRLRRRG
jgi:hypothetical protein